MAAGTYPRPTIMWMGVWSMNTAYMVNDGVSYQGIAYVAIQPNRNSPPTSLRDWTHLSSAPQQSISTEATLSRQLAEEHLAQSHSRYASEHYTTDDWHSR